jgi:hypothetical protein
MALEAEKVMQNYLDAYKKLYSRMPQDLRAIDPEWIIVNGARMRLSELEYLTQQMRLEYEQIRNQRKNLVGKLVKWFTG